METGGPRGGEGEGIHTQELAEPLLGRNGCRDSSEEPEKQQRREEPPDKCCVIPGLFPGDGEWRLGSEENVLRLRRSARNNTSQLAIIGSNVCPIESLDYEIIENDGFFQQGQEWRGRESGQIFQYLIFKWTLCFLLGLATGGVGFFVNLAVENVAGVKFVVTSNLMLSGHFALSFAVFAGANFVLLMTAAVMTAYFAPTAAGSGIPELKAYLNGVDAPDILSLRTLVVKIIGSILAVSSSLNVGKAGPLIQTGGCIASLLGQGGSKRYHLTCKWLRYFKNDRDRRDLVTCGSAAGAAAAFRAPVGGVLFALEAVSSWWRSALLWRSFFTTAVVAVVLRALIDVCRSGKVQSTNCFLPAVFQYSHPVVSLDYHGLHIADLALLVQRKSARP
ncbi:hypothetical protein Taro_013311 [Colocasia esculenta]|uniref:Uncharacterized protein n=1 Tax=Colocasia esculenta TaxID=4460 RepID=A0A843UBQ0_COLES|nr:hypothetical protein [Colocasia esculenta]